MDYLLLHLMALMLIVAYFWSQLSKVTQELRRKEQVFIADIERQAKEGILLRRKMQTAMTRIKERMNGMDEAIKEVNSEYKPRIEALEDWHERTKGIQAKGVK